MSDSAAVTVVIPTYQRPGWLDRAVRSLAAQDRAPVEVIAVSRDTDLPTHDAIARLQQASLPFVFRAVFVSEPGFMPPVKAGLEAAKGDIVAVMDDDAEAADGWVSGIVRHYDDPTVGAVGGRCINMNDDGPIPVPRTDRVGYVNWRGQFVGRMFYEPLFARAVEVDFLMGGNMSYRADVARRLEFDMSLNRNVAQGYEVDLGLQVRNMGLKIMFDPAVAIRHYSAPRAQLGMRATDGESAQWYAYNQARVALRRLPLRRVSVGLLYQMTVGERRAPGLLPFIAGPIGRRLGFDVPVAWSAIKGRMMAIRNTLPV